MNVEELLDMLEETLEEGTAVPFAAAKRVVDVDRCRDIVDEVRNNLPDELRDSKKIVADREQILKNAQTDADQAGRGTRTGTGIGQRDHQARTEDGRGAGERRTGTGEKDQQCLCGLL